MWCLQQAHQFLSAPFIHAIYCGIFHCVIYACLQTVYFNQFRRFDREKLHMLFDQSWTILSKQTEIPKNAKWRILWLVWSFTKMQPPGNSRVISDENPMSCDVADLMFNLRATPKHTFIRQTASKVLELHPLELFLQSLEGAIQLSLGDANFYLLNLLVLGAYF